MAGRVVPMFTNNGIPGVNATRHALVERLALGGVLLLLAIDLLQAGPPIIALLALAVAVVHAVRLWLWQPWRTLRTPLVWVLHLAYALDRRSPRAARTRSGRRRRRACSPCTR